MRSGLKDIFLYIILFIFVLTGLFHPFIANEKPLLIRQNGKIIWPVTDRSFRSGATYQIVLNPMIRYSYHTIDMKNTGAVSPLADQDLDPGQQRHFLGTDLYGRDVLAGLIYGCSKALIIGFGSMLIAFILGVLMSLFPVFYGDSDFRIRIKSLLLLIAGIIISVYLLAYSDYFIGTLSFTDCLALILLLFAVTALCYKLPLLNRYIPLPLDSTVNVFISIFQSLPSAFLILVLISLFSKSSVINIIVVIGLLKWPAIARYIRAEVLRVKLERFVEASKVLGLKDHVIVFRHIFPYTLTPVLVALSYGFAGTILLESTLSFLGIGTPAEHVSWGTLLGEARQNFSAWWLAFFPGLAIFTVIFIFNALGGKYSGRGK
ncbi:MAG: ABC transporter permease [Saprospiraceae bacterium]|nr:ABC transporter permease [Saprospiraceae bacterium]